ncbi:velvet factor [Mycena pura]|uniref:Velvet factor n=1 Tax=Mycena pura TaxID=153505 RepID=A0AAD6VU76_9AGAR|nr:velvet factor [Mycena pura]
MEEVKEYESIPLAGLICMVDLFEVPRPIDPSASNRPPPDVENVLTERSKCTTSLFGTTFVEARAVTMPGDGKKRLLFTFNDLAVRSEGKFVLRYRFFDIFSRPAGYPCPAVLAEHYGGPFIVCSTKTAPALKESTELTLILGRHGVPVNIRKAPRPSRRKLKP